MIKKMRYIEKINNVNNKRFFQMQIIKEGSEIYLYDDVSLLKVKISSDQLFDLIATCSISKRIIKKHLTFLESEDGKLVPYPSDSPIIKSEMKKSGFYITASNVNKMQEIELFSDFLETGVKVFYGGTEMYDEESNIKEHIFYTTFHDKCSSSFRLISFPHVYKVFDNYLKPEDIEDIPF